MSEQIFKRVRDILSVKSIAYGKLDTSHKMGLYDITVRMSDKVRRLKNLLLKKATGNKSIVFNDETIQDTVDDLIGYSILLLEAIEEREAKEGKIRKGVAIPTYDDERYK